MKYKLFLIAFVLCSFFNTTICETRPEFGMAQENETLEIHCAPELYDLITNWVNEYRLVEPGLNLNVTERDNIDSSESNTLCFSLGNRVHSSDLSAQWNIVIGHDAIVPIVNPKNPLIKEITQQGITAEKLTLLFTGSDDMDWTNLLDGVESQVLHFYWFDEESAKKDLAEFVNLEFNQIGGVKVSTSEELIAAIQSDVNAIGFCRLSDIRKAKSNEWIDNIGLAPVDKNGNRRIDNFENIYQTPNAFARGVWIGKYPSTLDGNVYVLSKHKPTKESTIQFLTWILSEGTLDLNSYGFSDIASAEKEEYIGLLAQNESAVVQTDKRALSGNWFYVFLGLILAGIVVVYLLGKLVFRHSTFPSNSIHLSRGLNLSTIEAPKGLYFDKSHTWSFIEKDGLVRLGLDDFMQHITGDITRIMMKLPGDIVKKGEKIMTISHLGKQLAIYSPISGTIVQQNSQLHSNSALINASPYTDGWVYLIEPVNWLREIQSMLMADKYKEWLKAEFMRLKVFLSYAVRENMSAYELIILQDGGELHDHILADLEPSVWEEFQAKFIDSPA